VRGRHILAIQDTSEIDYEAKSGRKRGLGAVDNERQNSSHRRWRSSGIDRVSRVAISSLAMRSRSAALMVALGSTSTSPAFGPAVLPVDGARHARLERPDQLRAHFLEA
jgi:hypothetical protein